MGERVQINDYQVDRADAVLCDLCLMCRIVTPVQDAAMDDGVQWAEATLEPAINPPFTWVRWVFPFEAVAGEQRMRVRVTDGNGEVATDERRSPLPDGATGWPDRSFEGEG